MQSRVLIAGGGVAGLEAAVALRKLAGDRAHVEIMAPRREFLYRPFAVGEPFGAAHVLRYDLEELAARCGAAFRWTSLSSVDTEHRLATTPDGEDVTYDHLIVTAGVKLLWSVPGATMFWGIPDESDAEDVVRRIGTGELRRLIFAMPAARSWSLPLYELALLAGALQAQSGVAGTETRIVVVTPEDEPLAVFGRQVSEQVSALLEERGIELVLRTHPVKQGGIASQQADAAAEAIAAELGCDLDPEPFDPILRGVLWTGTGHRYLYGRLTGGHGEASTLTEEPPWPPQEGKIMTRYLSELLDESG